MTQGFFVGSVADEFDQCIEQKIFHAQIVVDVERIKAEERTYIKEMPQVLHNLRGEVFTDDELDQIIRANYTKIKKDVSSIVIAEKELIAREQEAENQFASYTTEEAIANRLESP